MNTKKKVFAGNWNGFSPKLGEELDFFCLIIQRSNLDGGTLNLDGGTLTLDGGTRPPYNLSTVYKYTIPLVGLCFLYWLLKDLVERFFRSLCFSNHIFEPEKEIVDYLLEFFVRNFTE